MNVPPLWGHIRTSSHESNASFLALGWMSTAFLVPGVHKADLSLISGANYRDCEILSNGSLTDRPNDAEFPMGDRDHTSSDVTARRHATNGPPPSALLLTRPRCAGDSHSEAAIPSLGTPTVTRNSSAPCHYPVRSSRLLSLLDKIMVLTGADA